MADSNKNYVDMMIVSLKKKVSILEQLTRCNESLRGITSNVDEFLPETLDQILEDKEVLIGELTKLDDGFQNLYNRVKDVLTSEKEKYSEEIRTLQDLIRKITDQTASIEVEEKRIKADMDVQFSRIKQAAKETRKNTAVVSNYYQSMSKVTFDPQFMDQKK